MERPRTILVISEDESFREGFFTWERKSNLPQKEPVLKCKVTRVKLSRQISKDDSKLNDLLENTAFQEKKPYDMVLIADLFESLPVEKALKTLKWILQRTKKQVLLLVPELNGSYSTGLTKGLRSYHPIIFKDFDFSYLLTGREHENRIQMYNFFPNSAKLAKCEKEKKAPPVVPNPQKPLRVAYVLPDLDFTDKAKQILLQAQEMHHRGHHISLYLKSGNAPSAIPPWSGLSENDIDSQTVLGTDDDYLEQIEDTDVIILGWMEQVPEFRHSTIPVVLWDQGSSPVFGDLGIPLSSNSKSRARLRSFYLPPVHVLSASPLLQTILCSRFGRTSQLVCPAAPLNDTEPVPQDNPLKQILLVGDGQQDYKNFSFAIKALRTAARQGEDFIINWATPSQPVRDMVPKGMRIEYHIAPTQEKLDLLFKSADLFLSHSLYEAFSMSPLEAMAAGTPVLAINNGGIETYAVSGTNCLLYQQGDLTGFVKGIRMLLGDDALRARLAESGLATAAEYSVAAMCDSFESSLYNLI